MFDSKRNDFVVIKDEIYDYWVVYWSDLYCFIYDVLFVGIVRWSYEVVLFVEFWEVNGEFCVWVKVFKLGGVENESNVEEIDVDFMVFVDGFML